MEINDLEIQRLGAFNAQFQTSRAYRNLRRGLTKDPVELSVVRDVGNAHRKQCFWPGWEA